MHKRWEPWVLIGPGLVLYLIFGFAPLIMAVAGTVYEFGAYGLGWIGGSAYKAVFQSPAFWKSMLVTAKYVVYLLPSSMVLTVFCAMVLSWVGEKLQSIARFVFVVPTIVSAMMISVAWKYLYAQQGIINRVLGTQIPFLGQNPYAFWSIAVMVLFTSIGGTVIYVTAAFLSVDTELYEAAKLDGCNRAQETWHITLPVTMPILVFLTIQRLVGLLQTWQFPYAMTGGGPNYGTTTVLFYVFQEAFVNGRMPRAAVMSLVILVASLLVLIPYRLISGKRILE